jgi:hypothetical protein
MHTFFILIISLGHDPYIAMPNATFDRSWECVEQGRREVKESKIPLAKWTCQYARLEVDKNGKIHLTEVGRPVSEATILY